MISQPVVDLCFVGALTCVGFLVAVLARAIWMSRNYHRLIRQQRAIIVMPSPGKRAWEVKDE